MKFGAFTRLMIVMKKLLLGILGILKIKDLPVLIPKQKVSGLNYYSAYSDL